jgi:hypothetical protein
MEQLPQPPLPPPAPPPLPPPLLPHPFCHLVGAFLGLYDLLRVYALTGDAHMVVRVLRSWGHVDGAVETTIDAREEASHRRMDVHPMQLRRVLRLVATRFARRTCSAAAAHERVAKLLAHTVFARRRVYDGSPSARPVAWADTLRRCCDTRCWACAKPTTAKPLLLGASPRALSAFDKWGSLSSPPRVSRFATPLPVAKDPLRSRTHRVLRIRLCGACQARYTLGTYAAARLLGRSEYWVRRYVRACNTNPTRFLYMRREVLTHASPPHRRRTHRAVS